MVINDEIIYIIQFQGINSNINAFVSYNLI